MVKIERTFPAPASLEIEAKKASGKYGKEDVIKQLRADFNDKCYICEIKDLQDPEELLFFRLKEENVEIIVKDKDNEKALLTSTLIYEVFNLKNTEMRIYKSDMRFQELNKEMNVLYDNLAELKKNSNSRVVMRKLKALLRRETKFAAFKRNYIREHEKDYEQLLPYIA